MQASTPALYDWKDVLVKTVSSARRCITCRTSDMNSALHTDKSSLRRCTLCSTRYKYLLILIRARSVVLDPMDAVAGSCWLAKLAGELAVELGDLVVTCVLA